MWSTFLVLVRTLAAAFWISCSCLNAENSIKMEILLNLQRLCFKRNITCPYFNVHLSALRFLCVVCLGMLRLLTEFGNVFDHLWRFTQTHKTIVIHSIRIQIIIITLSIVYLSLQPVWRPLPHPLCQLSGQSSPGQQPSWPSSSLWSDRTADKPAEGKPAGPTGQWWPHRVTPACRLQEVMVRKGREGQEWESK